MLQLHPHIYVLLLIAAIAYSAPLALTIALSVILLVVTFQRLAQLAAAARQREALKAAILEGLASPEAKPSIGLTTD